MNNNQSSGRASDGGGGIRKVKVSSPRRAVAEFWGKPQKLRVRILILYNIYPFGGQPAGGDKICKFRWLVGGISNVGYLFRISKGWAQNDGGTVMGNRNNRFREKAFDRRNCSAVTAKARVTGQDHKIMMIEIVVTPNLCASP